MKNARTNTSAPHQLALLPDLAPAPNVSARFLLSRDTRELGMRHVAEIRHTLAERKAARESVNVLTLPTRSDRAA